jgi:hypothetical protein
MWNLQNSGAGSAPFHPNSTLSPRQAPMTRPPMFSDSKQTPQCLPCRACHLLEQARILPPMYPMLSVPSLTASAETIPEHVECDNKHAVRLSYNVMPLIGNADAETCINNHCDSPSSPSGRIHLDITFGVSRRRRRVPA